MSRKWLVVTKWCFLLAMVLVLCLAVGVGPVAGAGGTRYVDKNGTRNCQGKTPCHPNIQAAVNAAQPGDTIYVFPATYNAGVDLSQMDPEGNISLITVDANGNPTPGTVTIDNPGDAPEIYTGNPPFDGDVTIDGFVLRSDYGAIDLWVGGATAASSDLGPPSTRDVEIKNVDASETGEDGIKVRAEGDVTIEDCTTNGNNGAGIHVHRTWGDVTITGCTSNENSCGLSGVGGGASCLPWGIAVRDADGKIKIEDCTANRNEWDGIYVAPLLLGGEEVGPADVTTPDQVTINRCTANENGEGGITVRDVEGDVGITDCTTNGNDEDGVYVSGFDFRASSGLGRVVGGGDVNIKNCTSNGNGESGFDPEDILGTLSIQACIARDNEDGVDLDRMWNAESILVNGSVICGNECGVLLVLANTGVLNAVGINLEGNWWGCPGGPEAAGCDPICQDDSMPVDFTPWIAKITDSVTVDPAMVGQATEVSFQFSANPTAVYLGRGPGDLRGPAPFTVSTDNGKLDGNGSTVHKFLWAEGTLKVTLVPEHGGTATVTVSGPCGLTALDGAEAVVDVLGEDFVPEPGTMLLLGSGLMGLAGYAGLRLRKK